MKQYKIMAMAILSFHSVDNDEVFAEALGISELAQWPRLEHPMLVVLSGAPLLASKTKAVLG